jgi:cytochrome c-type biogenesis protein CcmE
MNRMRLKLTIVSLTLVGALAYLAIAGARQAWVYHLTVDQFLASPQYHNQRLRLAGTVDTQDFSLDQAALCASFQLKGTSQRIAVVYHGVIPDLFQAGRDVVVEGQLNNAGVFQADVLMTKCASKYESDGKGHMRTSQQDGGAS